MEHLGRVIVVPVVNPASVHPLLVAAARIADADGGLVVPLTVIPVRADADVRAHAWNGVADAESIACELGVRAQGVVVEADDLRLPRAVPRPDAAGHRAALDRGPRGRQFVRSSPTARRTKSSTASR